MYWCIVVVTGIAGLTQLSSVLLCVELMHILTSFCRHSVNNSACRRVYCEDIVVKCQCDVGDIMKCLEAGDSLNHGGRFEWVDSVLVQCLQDGDWLLIENVNFCRFVF